MIIIVLSNKCSFVLLFDYIVYNILSDWVLLTEEKRRCLMFEQFTEFMVNTWLFVLAILLRIAKRNLQLAGIALLNLALEVNETTLWFGRRQL